MTNPNSGTHDRRDGITALMIIAGLLVALIGGLLANLELSIGWLLFPIGVALLATGYAGGFRAGTFERLMPDRKHVQESREKKGYTEDTREFGERHGCAFLSLALIAPLLASLAGSACLPPSWLPDELRWVARLFCAAIASILGMFIILGLGRWNYSRRKSRAWNEFLDVNPAGKEFFHRFKDQSAGIITASQESLISGNPGPLHFLLNQACDVDDWSHVAEALGYLGDETSIAALENSEPTYPDLRFREDDDSVQERSSQERDAQGARVSRARASAISRIQQRVRS